MLRAIANRLNAARVWFTPSGSGAISESVQSRMRWDVYLTDFLTDNQRAALRDGTSVDTATAWANAVARTSSVGGTIWVPNGNQVPSARVLISGKTGLIIRGESKDGVRINKSFAGTALFQFLNANHWGVEDVFLQGSTDTSGTGDLIYIEGSSYGRLKNSKVFNARGYGIKIEQGTGASGAYFNTIEGNHFFNGGVGYGVAGANIYCGSESSETKVISGECQSSPGTGWLIEGGNGHVGIGASFEGNTVNSVKVGTASQACEVILFGCRYEGGSVQQYGIHVLNANTTCMIFGGNFSGNTTADLFDPDSARVTYVATTGSSSVSPLSGSKHIGTTHYFGGTGGAQISDSSGTWKFKGPSTTVIESGANTVDVKPAGTAVVSFGQNNSYGKMTLQKTDGSIGGEIREAASLIIDSVNGNRNIQINANGNGVVTSPNTIIARNATAIPAGGTAGAGFRFSSTSNFGIFFGSGAPTLAAAKGSLYLRSDGTTTNDRAYVNTDGGTTWTALTTAA